MNIDWQVESGLRTSVFLSATSSDLGDCRRRVSEILQEAGIFLLFKIISVLIPEQ
jgi:hypothetical protein